MMSATAWLLIFSVGGMMGSTVAIPGIASEASCKELYGSLQKTDSTLSGRYNCVAYSAAISPVQALEAASMERKQEEKK